MSRKVRNSLLESRSSRLRLPVARKPAFVRVAPGISLGYRRNQAAGTWVVRVADGRGGSWTKAIGFADDYLKVVRKRNLGLSGRSKLVLQFLAAGFVAVALVTLTATRQYSTHLMVPFIKQFRPDLVIEGLRHYPHLWWLAFTPFVLFVMLVLVGSSNAVNLTDGLDGLAIGCTVIAAGALTVLTYLSGHAVFSEYLELQKMQQVAELTVFCVAMVGSSI